MKSKVKFRGCIAILFLFLFVMCMVEWWVARYVFVPGSIYNNLLEHFTKPYGQGEYIAQPYVNYINNPDLKDPNDRFNNNAGLRLSYEVNLNKPDSIYRILFLGGSTTYGCLVSDTDTYVHRLGDLLNKQLPIAGLPYKSVECLNGGMGGATSAEILTHYLLKYQYMQPDLVVVNAGINDCLAYGTYQGAVYQPDYRHWRRSVENLPEPTPLIKKMMQSKIIALLVIKTKYLSYFSMNVTNNELQHFNHQSPWFTFGNDSMFTLRFNAFYNNLKHLGLVAHDHHQKVLLVTEIIDTLTMPKEYINLYYTSLLQHNRLLDSLSNYLPCNILHLNNGEFTSKEFVNDDVDGIHLNPSGERLKAKRISPAITKIIIGN